MQGTPCATAQDGFSAGKCARKRRSRAPTTGRRSDSDASDQRPTTPRPRARRGPFASPPSLLLLRRVLREHVFQRRVDDGYHLVCIDDDRRVDTPAEEFLARLWLQQQ